MRPIISGIQRLKGFVTQSSTMQDTVQKKFLIKKLNKNREKPKRYYKIYEVKMVKYCSKVHTLF